MVLARPSTALQGRENPALPFATALIGCSEGCCIPARRPGSSSAARRRDPLCKDVEMYKCDAAGRLTDTST